VHLKTDKVDLKKKPPRKICFLHFFAIHSSSRHEKCCRMSERIFCLFQCSKNIQWYSSSRFCGKIIQKHSYNWAKIQKEHLQLYYAIAARLLMIIIANENKRSFSFCDILRNQPRYYRQKSQKLWYFVLKIVLTYLLWEKKKSCDPECFLEITKTIYSNSNKILNYGPFPLLICTWFLKNQFGKIKFDKLDF
jgi:hypothetical protein